MQIELYYIDSVRKEALYAKKIRKLFLLIVFTILRYFFPVDLKALLMSW